MYGIRKYPIVRPLGKQFLNLAKVVVEQDAAILGKLYANTPQKMKLNNEIGMDWVQRNFERFPEPIEPHLSRSFESQHTLR